MSCPHLRFLSLPKLLWGSDHKVDHSQEDRPFGIYLLFNNAGSSSFSGCYRSSLHSSEELFQVWTSFHQSTTTVPLYLLPSLSIIFSFPFSSTLHFDLFSFLKSVSDLSEEVLPISELTKILQNTKFSLIHNNYIFFVKAFFALAFLAQISLGVISDFG